MSVCPRCGAAGEELDHCFECRSRLRADGTVRVGTQCKLNQIIRYCEKHCTPASNVGAHALAAAVLKIAREQ